MSAKYLDNAGVVYLVSKVKELLSAKVDKIDGKSLSTNDFTNDLLTKLNGIASGATKTTVDTALSSTSTNPVQNKVVNSALGAKAPIASPTFTGTPKAPTATAGTSTTQIATTAFVTTAITTAIEGITGIDFSVVTQLPTTGAKGIIYLVPNGGSNNNAYDEYVWVNDSFEKIGTTDVDLSGYIKTSDLVAVTTAEIDAMFA